MRFVTDVTLGKLGRHLRAAGFDTLCQHQNRAGGFFDRVDQDRVILTRTTSLVDRFKNRPLLFIRSNDPLLQFKQVVRELEIDQNDFMPFSRCLGCNVKVLKVDKETLKGHVPDYVWRHQRTFHACRQCRQVYWAGSHRERFCNWLAALFQ